MPRRLVRRSGGLTLALALTLTLTPALTLALTLNLTLAPTLTLTLTLTLPLTLRYDAMEAHVPAYACRVRGDAASWRKVTPTSYFLLPTPTYY